MQVEKGIHFEADGTGFANQQNYLYIYIYKLLVLAPHSGKPVINPQIISILAIGTLAS